MTVTAPPDTRSARRLLAGQRPFFLSRLHSLTGILLGGWILVHLLVNACLIEGYREFSSRTVFQKQLDLIHSLPFLTAIKWAVIYLPLLYHTIYGLWLTYRAVPNVNQYPFGKNIFYAIQRVTALLLVAFIVFHVTAMKGWWSPALKFDPAHASETATAHLTASWLIGWFIYPVGILAACYHLAHGFWSAAITWGITTSRAAQRRWARVCVVLFVWSFACGMAALIAGLTQRAIVRH